MIVEYIRYEIENERQREFENVYERAERSLRDSSKGLTTAFLEFYDVDISPRKFKLKVKLPKVVRKSKEP